jgi:hypothetical protein
MAKEIPLYKRKIQMKKERQEWPAYDEVRYHERVTSDLIIKYGCHPDCGHVYECVVHKMRCKPYIPRLWKQWSEKKND